ncbi:MAG: hypothetical protein RXO24_09710, partial [Acidilobus sp.]
LNLFCEKRLWEGELSEDQQAEYVEYRARIPKDMYAKLHHLKIHYQYTRKYNVRSINDIILMAIKEFLEKHKKDLEPSSTP